MKNVLVKPNNNSSKTVKIKAFKHIFHFSKKFKINSIKQLTTDINCYILFTSGGRITHEFNNQ